MQRSLDNSTTLSRVVRAAIGGLGAFLLLYMLVYFAWEGTKYANWAKLGHTETELEVKGDSAWVFTEVDSSEIVGSFPPSPGDTLLSVNDTLTTFAQIEQFVQSRRKPGDTDRLTFQRFGRERTVLLEAQAITLAERLPFLLLMALRFLIVLTFLLVGLWSLYKRPGSGAVRTLTLFCFAMASLLLVMVSIFNSNLAGFTIPNRPFFNQLLGLIGLFHGGFWLNLNMVFPRRSSFLRRTGDWGYLAIYFPQILAVAARAHTWITGNESFTQLVLGLVLLQFVLGFGLLARHHKRARTVLERRQTKLVLYGSVFGISALGILVAITAFAGQWFFEKETTFQLTLINLVFAALLLTPLSLAYAIGKYRLLEVEAKLRRGTRYFFISFALFAVFFLIVYLVSGMLLHTMGITSRTPTLLIAMALALGISPAQRWLRDYIERRFNPQRYQLRVMISDFLQRMGSFPDRETLWNQLSVRLEEAVGVQHVVAVMRNSDGNFTASDGSEPPFLEDSDLIAHLERTGRPVPLDEAMASLRIPFTDGQIMWLQKERIHLVLPMFARLKMIGFLGLGRTTRSEDYTPEDIEVLTSLTSQLALATENLRLLEENLEKRRLEEQLSMARDIQEGFLPRKIPHTPGLELAASSRFSLEVAGDYYDVIGLRDGKTVIAMGDVSGKGAGAAMIMANLQAALRASVKVGVDLREVVAEINDLIFHNTPSEQYVTFFAGVFDPVEMTFSYVNAGHNAPLLYRENGEVEELHSTGLILGAFHDVSYEWTKVRMAPGENLFLYTDGLTEAMNPRGEEFGIERVHEHLKSMVLGTTPAEALTKLEREVMRYHGKRALEDDCTMMLLRARLEGAEMSEAV